MNHYYDPPTYVDWEAEFFCDRCEKDTLHYFAAPERGSVTEATCYECEHSFEVDPDDMRTDAI